jgi:HTH-type transcriptional regulator/antitoxin HipB
MSNASNKIKRRPEPLRSGEAIGEWLRQCRRDRGMTQDDLSSRSGITKPQISRIEGGIVDAKLSSIFALVAAMNLDLVGGPRGMHLGLTQQDEGLSPNELRLQHMKDLF